MSKEALKIPYIPENADPSQWDTDRHVPKAEGGGYEKENYRVILPVEHMKHHGTLRIRPEHLEELKAGIDEREQFLKLRIKISNQLLAFERQTDHPRESIIEKLNEMLDNANSLELEARKTVEKLIIAIAPEDPLVAAALDIDGVGPMTVAYLAAYVDLEKAQYPSSVWAYVGYDKASHERYTKGTASGGNKTLRTALFRTADSMVKTRGAYREVYDKRKDRQSFSENIVKSRNTQGKLVEVAWKDTKPCHRHGDAMRVMMKHFLRDYWLVGRKIQGLPTQHMYVEEYLGHTTIIPPEARGWPIVE